MKDKNALSEEKLPNLDDAEHSKSQRRPWIRFALVGVVLVAVVLAAVFLLREYGSPADAAEMDPLNFAEVVITDLIQEETFNGTLGSIEDDPVTTQMGGTITEIAEKGSTISQGEALFAIDNQPVVLLYGNLPAFREDIAIGEDTVTVSSQPNGTITWVAEPGNVIQQGDVLYRVDDQPVVALYGDQPAYRDIAIVATGGEAVDETVTVLSQLNGTITWVAEPGAVIQQGDVLYRVDDQPVIALYGDQPAYRDLYNSLGYTASEASLTAAQSQVTIAAQTLAQADVAYNPYRNKPDGNLNKAYYGAAWAAAQQAYDSAVFQLNALTGTSGGPLTGDDVLQLEAALLMLGYDDDGNLVADGTFTYETTRAVRAFQVDVGLEEDGVLDLGEIVFLPGPAQVLGQLAEPGDPVQGAVMSVTTSDATIGADVLQLQEALISLGYDADGELEANGTFTPETTQAVLAFQTAAGLETDGVVDFGEIVFLPGPAQVLESLAAPGDPAGGSVVSIATGDPAYGIDILQLEEALVALGYDADGTLVSDGRYTLETNQAVLDFQAAAGLETDGIVNLGEIIFLPGEVRITTQLATKGSSISQGTPILGISLSEKVVYMALPAGDQGVLDVGDAVSVEMPDNTLVPATVVYVSQTATPSEYGPATFEVRIELDDPSVAVGLDEAPVDVIIVSDSIEGVMAIPVSALVALLEGGYAVEVDTGGGQIQLVAVEVGFFSTNNMIEITSGALKPGDRVVVP
jgi:peptidoglycan hydrolase-like protein with peptidoglycan-binding domain/multidrug resistance efflux pump